MNKKLLIKSLQVFLVRGFGASAAFFLTLVVTHTSNTHDAGLFFYSLAIVNVLSTFILLGAPQALIRIVGANDDTGWSLINNQFSIIIKVVVSISLAILAIFFVFNDQIANYVFHKSELTSCMYLIGLATLWLALVQLFAAVLQGRREAVLASTIQNVVVPAGVIAAITFLYFANVGLSTYRLLGIYTGSLLFSFLIGYFSWVKEKRAGFRYVSGFPAELRSSLYPLFIVSSMGLCVQWAGQFAAGKFLMAEEIAYFSTAQRTAMLVSFVLLAVNLVVAPKFAHAFAKGAKADINKLSLLSSRLMVLMATPLLLFMFFFPQWLMGLFGEEYIVAAPLLQIMAVGQFINVITGSVGYLLTMTHHEKDFRNVVLFSGPMAVILAFVLTNSYGLEGAAYATAISVATQNLLAAWMVKKRLGFNVLNLFSKELQEGR